MQSDIRQTSEFQAVEEFYTALFEPGVNHVFSAEDLAPTADGVSAYLSGLSFQGGLIDGPSMRIYRADLASGELVDVFGRPARLGRPSPDGARIGCVIQLDEDGAEEICIASPDGTIISRHQADGLVEQMEWSADGLKLLLVVAGAGADLAGFQGGYATRTLDDGPAWLPQVQTGEDANFWRRLWLLDVEARDLRLISALGTNIWEATWSGLDHIAAVCSDHHGEGSWYTSTLRLIGVADGREQVLYAPADQIGLPVGEPDGTRVAFVEALCSDRGIVCGQLLVVDRQGEILKPDTKLVEVTSLAWREAGVLHYAGQRAFDTVVGDVHLDHDETAEHWSSQTLTCGNWYPAARPLPGGRSLIVAEAYEVAPRLAVIEQGELLIVRSFEAPRALKAMAGCGKIAPAAWTASDGLEIHGWLVTPQGAEGRAPLVLDIHGGPVWANRNRWMGRCRTTPLLVARGCAILYPNPRGSSTRGQDYVRHVKGDMGGADAGDFIAAIDHFISTGLADPAKLACTGTSYGGFMSSWLVTQDSRFAAAAPISPVTNWFSQHRTSQIPHFDLSFLDGSASRSDGMFFSRSPVMFADRVRTPCLNLTGALDKNTPPSQALEFHQSLREHGVESVLVVYPQDGHSLRGYPAYIDSAARILNWFGRHLRLSGGQ